MFAVENPEFSTFYLEKISLYSMQGCTSIYQFFKKEAFDVSVILLPLLKKSDVE